MLHAISFMAVSLHIARIEEESTKVVESNEGDTRRGKVGRSAMGGVCVCVCLSIGTCTCFNSRYMCRCVCLKIGTCIGFNSRYVCRSVCLSIGTCISFNSPTCVCVFKNVFLSMHLIVYVLSV